MKTKCLNNKYLYSVKGICSVHFIMRANQFKPTTLGNNEIQISVVIVKLKIGIPCHLENKLFQGFIFQTALLILM